MQRQHTSLRSGVVHRASTAKVASYTCNAHNVTFLRIQHSRQEFLDGNPVAEEVDTEDLLKIFFRRIEDGMSIGDACIVD